MTTATSLRLTAVLAVAAAVVLPRPAGAQSASARAQALFDEGKRLMAKGDYARACEKFEASDRVEAKAGTELNLAVCRNANGQTATAWAVFKQAAATAKRAGDRGREIEARKKAAELKPGLLSLTITVSDGAKVDGLVVKRNATAIEEAEWDQPMPVDPDEYTVSAEAPGYKPWSKTVEVNTKSKTVEIPPLEPEPEPKPKPKRAEPRDTGGAAEDAEPAGGHDAGAVVGPTPSGWTGRRKLSLVLAVVGVAAAGAGIPLGMHANTLERESDDICGHSTCHEADAVALNGSARHYALGANIGFAVGGAAVVGAAVLWFLGAPHASETARRDNAAVIPSFGAGQVGVAFARSF